MIEENVPPIIKSVLFTSDIVGVIDKGPMLELNVNDEMSLSNRSNTCVCTPILM